MKLAQITEKTDLAIQKAQAAKDASTVIANPDKFYVVVDSSVIVPTHYAEQPTLQTFIDNEVGVTIFPVLNDYIHIITSKTQLTGTVAVGAGLKSVVGTGTLFNTELAVDDIISIAAQEIEVESITDDDDLDLKDHHQYGATDVIAYKVVKQWWRLTSGDGTDAGDYTSISYDPENQAGISKAGLYWPDPENVIADYTADFFDDPGTGQPFEGDLTGDDYFQSAVDPKSMHIKIVKTAGTWALGTTAHILLVVDTDGDLFAIIHSTGSDFSSGAEWSLIPEYAFLWASILEGMIVDSVKRTVEADSTVVQIEASYQTVRTIARSMGKNADLVVGTAAQNSLQEADHLINNWIADLIAGSRTRVLFRIGTHVPDSDWGVTEKTHLDFDRDAEWDMTGRILTFDSPTGRAVLVNAPNDSLVLAGNCEGFSIETDNEGCLDSSAAKGMIFINGKPVYPEFQHVRADVTVGTALTKPRVTHLETTFVAALVAGNKLLFTTGITLTAARTLTTQAELFMDGPGVSINLDTFDFTLVEASGNLNVTRVSGKVVLNGLCKGLIINGTVTVEEGPNFAGSYCHNGEWHSKNLDIQFLNQPDMVVMTAAELANYSDDPKFVKVDQATKTFKTREGTGRVPVTGDLTVIKSVETLTAELEFPATYDRPKITTDRHFQIPMGDKGAGEPYEIYVRGGGGICEFITDKTIDDLLALQAGTMPTAAELKDQQYIKNRGEGNRIILNNQQIYSGDRPTEIYSPAQIIHPYVFPHNGYSFDGVAKAAVNDDETLLIDAWKAWGGIESLEIAPLHNPFVSAAFWYMLYMPDDAGNFMRPATHFGGTGGVDPDIHDRTSPNGSETLTSGNYTSSASAEISGISDSNIKKFKRWARVQASGIPGGSANTTIISKIVNNGVDDNSIFLIDSETGLPVSVSATGDLTIDMGGNSGISLQEDTFQAWQLGADQDATGAREYWGISGVRDVGSDVSALANNTAPILSTLVQGNNRKLIAKDDGTNGTPRASSQTRPTSTQRFKYTLP